MTAVIQQCTDHDFDAILEVINDAARAYEGVIPVTATRTPTCRPRS